MNEPSPWFAPIAEAAVAIGTFLAVLVALFGDWFKGRVFRPALEIRLVNNRGVFQQSFVPDANSPTGKRVADCRYYGLRVRNSKRWPIATQAQVYLLRLEEPRADGSLGTTWAGELPMRWVHQEVNPLARAIGPAAICDLLCVVEDKWISLLPLIEPIGFPMIGRRGPVSNVVATFQARS